MSVPKVFIIESLEFEDEENERYEGNIISNILKLSSIQTKYYYVRTKKEFIEVVKLFEQSDYRYLHISCHGGKDKASIWTTLDNISFDELSKILYNSLDKKRLFLSSCSVVNQKLAKAIIPITGCYSIIGPKKDIEFRDAAIMWAAFYHLMFKKNNRNMSREGLLENMQKVVDTFGQSLNYFSSSRSRIYKNTQIIPRIYADLDEDLG
jgi:hypothetical protein